MESEQNARLKPPRGLRRIRPRSCGTCKFLHVNYQGEPSYFCTRPDGPEFGYEGGDQFLYVCDLYTRGRS